jgi:tetratricopeptide (TPR) repeat protein
MMFYHLGQYKEGLELLSTIKNDYKNPDIHRLESLILMKLDSYEEALKSINTAIKEGLNNAKVHACQAQILSELNRESKAIELYKDQIKINCKNSSYFDGTGLTESDFYSNLGTLYYRSSNDYEALLCYEKALELNSSNLYVLNNLSALLYENDYFKEADGILTQLSDNGCTNLIDFSFLASVKTKLKQTTEKPLDENRKEDDQEYISDSLNSLNLYNKIENLVLSCIDSSDEKIKQTYKSEINYIITKNPSLYKFVINLFSNADNQEKAIKSLEDIFATDNQTLIHKFFQHKKKLGNQYSSLKKEEKSQLQISDEIKGLHKINTGTKFKGEWFFKFTKDVCDKMGGLLEKIKDRINDLHIVKETAQGKVGFKKHELKDSKFHLLKLVGLGEDKEIYSGDMHKYYDSIGKKSYIFSSFNHIGNHQEISKIINQGKYYNYTCHDIDNLGDFQSLLSSEDSFL